MPRKCCVPGCTSNYKSSAGKYINVFSFPKDLHKRGQWLRAIHRDNYEPGSTAVVCIKHFCEQHIVREDTATRSDGSILVVPRKIPKLTEDACPSIFPNLPSYISSEPAPKRKDPEKRRGEMLERDEGEFSKWLEDDVISDFPNFKSRVRDMKLDGFTVIINDNDVNLLKIDTTEIPKIVVALKINSHFIIHVSHNNITIPNYKFKWVLGKEMIVDKWSKFDALVSHLNAYTSEIKQTEEKIVHAANILRECSEEMEEDSSEYLKTKFLEEQVQLITQKVPRYTPNALLWACSINFSNPAAYRQIRNTSVLSLPHPDYLRQLSQTLGPDYSFKSMHMK